MSRAQDIPLRLPAFTAYAEPDRESMEISEQGVRGWSDPQQELVWYGWLALPGSLSAQVTLRLPQGEETTLALQIAPVIDKVVPSGQPQTGNALPLRIGKGMSGVDGTVRVAFEPLTISQPGYYRFALRGRQRSAATFGAPDALLLSGPPAQGAHFNHKERRNAASVHLGYPVGKELQAVAFYNEVTVRTEPLHSYYMACGFRRGYFGIQVNSPTERRIIFSVWDSGDEAIDRTKVAPEDQVTLLAKGDGVVAHGFGNEGTGGHSHLVYPWKRGQTYKFLVTAAPGGKTTTYTAYFYFPERAAWGLIARFRAPKDGGTLTGLYSFSENFWGTNGQLRRVAEFGNQWIQLTDGIWHELTTARFTCDATGRAGDRKDFAAGVTRSGSFFLSHGGFVDNKIAFGDQRNRPPRKQPPVLRLPEG